MSNPSGGHQEVESQGRRCALCSHDGEDLQDSHVIPAWCFRRILDCSPASDGQPVAKTAVALGLGGAFYVGEQYTERLLCRACEIVLGEHDKALAELSRRPDGSFPLLHRLRPVARLPAGNVLVELHDADAASLERFGASFFWRASEASRSRLRRAQHPKAAIQAARRDPYRGCRVPLVFQESLRLAVRDAGPLPDDIRICVSVSMAPPPGLDAMVLLASRPDRALGFARLEATFFGISFVMAVGAASVVAESISLRQRKAVVGDGTQLVAGAVRAAVESRPLGRLARDWSR